MKQNIKNCQTVKQVKRRKLFRRYQEVFYTEKKYKRLRLQKWKWPQWKLRKHTLHMKKLSAKKLFSCRVVLHHAQGHRKLFYYTSLVHVTLMFLVVKIKVLALFFSLTFSKLTSVFWAFVVDVCLFHGI